MPFVNEFISKPDIEKHGLDKNYFDLNPSQTELPSSFNPHWTIDRERDIILRQTRGSNPARDGEHWIEFCVQISGQKYFVKVNTGNGSDKLSEVPFIMAWGEVVDFYPSDIEVSEHDEVLRLLKEALTVRGYDGARKQIANIVVKFEF